MEKFDVKKHWDDFINNKLVVNCETEELANEFLMYCYKQDMRWFGNDSLLTGKNPWYSYKENACYFCENKKITIGNKNYALRKKNTIVKYQGIKKININPYNFFNTYDNHFNQNKVNKKNNIKYECNYPEDFYNFYDGVNIPDLEINKWIKECIAKLENNKDQNHSFIASGNTMVQVNRYVYAENTDEYYYTVTVSKGYYSANIGLLE